MGQYHLVVNLDKREFLHPHKLGDGLKLVEQMNAHGGVMAALWVLLACSNGRGGGDIPDGLEYEFQDDPPRVAEVIPDPEYRRLAQEYIGRWAGDRIAVVGDYAEDGDLPPEFRAGRIFEDCLEGRNGWRDISDQILPIVERACGVRVERGEGWRRKDFLDAREGASHFAPDAVFAPRS